VLRITTMGLKRIGTNLKTFLLGTAVYNSQYLSPKMIGAISSLVSPFTRPKSKLVISGLKKALADHHVVVELRERVHTQLNKNCRKKLYKNMFVNTWLKGEAIRFGIKAKEGWLPPFFLTISPTMRCNLRCTGCYAGDYTQKDDLPIEVVDRVLKEAKELGIYFAVISGGEPFIRKDILTMFEKHNDMIFLVYTNGQLIDEELAKKLAKLGNVAPGISVEGFESETDKRRGKGVQSKVLSAMANLKKHGVLFGFSATATKHNTEIIASDEFIDFYIKQGCFFGWYFQYTPIGKKPDVQLMATPEQRQHLRKRVESIRKNKAIFIGDFWNDGPYVGGCLAGGGERGYFHIICTGDVEPCVFCHFAVDNIKKKSLREVINSDFFKAFVKRQPYNKSNNLLAPCALIDNPEVLRELVEKYGAHPTHPGSDSVIKDPAICKHLDEYSKKLKEITDPVWKKDYQQYETRWFSGQNKGYKKGSYFDPENLKSKKGLKKVIYENGVKKKEKSAA
jgi:MoaA/NifB/PqqE/SkfB family radical SAM enzyme